MVAFRSVRRQRGLLPVHLLPFALLNSSLTDGNLIRMGRDLEDRYWHNGDISAGHFHP